LRIEGADPASVAADQGVSTATRVAMLRDAMEALAAEYEDVAYASLGESHQERVRAARARQNGRGPSSMSAPAGDRLS
jgi:hypothetical protein